ncbi:MAG: alkaline phosphatase family protein [Myxococcales bacterium]|nr:alkaline phosphatase family protein [Myxococcales bacterium]
MRPLLLLGSAWLACTRTVAPAPAPAPLASTTASTPPSPIARRVVLVSIDGLKPEYLAEADARGLAIPALRRLMKEGTRADAMTSVYPTVTYPAHTTLITGVSPKAHGIVNNLPFDPHGKNQDGWYWYASDVKVPTVVDVARKNHLPTANVYWPVTVGAAFDASFPQVWRAQNDEDDKLMRALATPGLADAVAKQYGSIPAEHRTDVERANAAEWILGHDRPALALVYFTDLDTEQHKTGPFSKGAYAKLELIDKQLGRLLAASETAGTFAQTSWIVVSDHGFAAVHSAVKPSVLLRERGFLTVGGGKVTSFRAAAWKAGAPRRSCSPTPRMRRRAPRCSRRSRRRRRTRRTASPRWCPAPPSRRRAGSRGSPRCSWRPTGSCSPTATTGRWWCRAGTSARMGTRPPTRACARRSSRPVAGWSRARSSAPCA